MRRSGVRVFFLRPLAKGTTFALYSLCGLAAMGGESMQTAKKFILEKLARGTSLLERQAAMRARAGQKLRIVRANQEKAQGSLRIKLVE